MLKTVDLTNQITGASGQTLSVLPSYFTPGSTLLVLNGNVQRPGVDYAESADRQTLTILQGAALNPTADAVYVIFAPTSPSATIFDDLQFFDLTSQVTGGPNPVLSIAPNYYDPGSTVFVLNGMVQEEGQGYKPAPDRQTIIVLGTLNPGTDKCGLYYLSPAISPIPSSFSTKLLRSDYLFGLDLKDQFGHVMTDSTLSNKIAIGIARTQRELRDFSLTPQVIKSTAVLGITDSDGNVLSPAEPDAIAAANLFEDPYDYDVNDYLNWGYLDVRRKPIISVERIRLIYPTGQTIITYPKEWIKIYHKFGQIQIVPMAGSFKQFPLIGQGAMYLPLLSGFLTRAVPSLIHVDYTVGLTTIPDDLKDAVYKLAACEVLKVAGQGRMPGVASASTAGDGLSESTTLTQGPNVQLYGGLIKQFEEDAKKFLVDYYEAQKGITMRVM